MSKIKEHYQDADGNWLLEAEAILARATAIANDRKQPERTLMPLDGVDDFFVDLFEGKK